MIDHPWRDHWMEGAFLGCVSWALGKKELVDAYRAETGDVWEPARTAIDKMVDTATGSDKAFFEGFARWVADNVFGNPEDLEDYDKRWDGD